jgi:curved DNA-binding protein CbpA
MSHPYYSAETRDCRNDEINESNFNAQTNADISRDINYYQVLGVNVDATEDEIKLALKNIALKCHPDKIPTNLSEDEKTKRGERFKAAQTAKDIICVPELRRYYDHHRLQRNLYRDINYYQVLGVDVDADEGEIMDAYRMISSLNHPNECVNLSEDEKTKREERFYAAQTAKEILNDSDLRGYYDDIRLERNISQDINYYLALGVNVHATVDEIIDAYSKIASLNLHDERFYAAQTAKEILCNHVLRRRYNDIRKDKCIDEIFQMCFADEDFSKMLEKADKEAVHRNPMRCDGHGRGDSDDRGDFDCGDFDKSESDSDDSDGSSKRKKQRPEESAFLRENKRKSDGNSPEESACLRKKKRKSDGNRPDLEDNRKYRDGENSTDDEIDDEDVDEDVPEKPLNPVQKTIYDIFETKIKDTKRSLNGGLPTILSQTLTLKKVDGASFDKKNEYFRAIRDAYCRNASTISSKRQSWPWFEKNYKEEKRLTDAFVKQSEIECKKGKLDKDKYDSIKIAWNSKREVISRFMGKIRKILYGTNPEKGKGKGGGGGGGGGGDGGMTKKKKLTRKDLKYYLYSLIFKDKIKVCNTKKTIF